MKSQCYKCVLCMVCTHAVIVLFSFVILKYLYCSRNTLLRLQYQHQLGQIPKLTLHRLLNQRFYSLRISNSLLFACKLFFKMIIPFHCLLDPVTCFYKLVLCRLLLNVVLTVYYIILNTKPCFLTFWALITHKKINWLVWCKH